MCKYKCRCCGHTTRVLAGVLEVWHTHKLNPREAASLARGIQKIRLERSREYLVKLELVA